MGVSGFHKFLESKHVIKPIPKGFKVAALVVDIADLLHVNIRKSHTPLELLKNVIKALNTILKKITLKYNSGLPGTLVIMMDGSAPLAKLSLQIKRRRTQSARGKSENAKKSNIQKGRKPPISSLFLSPGTSLTNFLENGLRQAFPHAILSGCTEPGEGEIKAIHWLLTNRKHFKTERVMLLGGDADLVLLACAARPLTNLFCAKSERKGKFTGVNVDQFIRMFPNYTREDLCVMNFFRGNDYLPTLEGCTTSFSSQISKTIEENGGLVDVASGNLKSKGLLKLCQSLMNTSSSIYYASSAITKKKAASQKSNFTTEQKQKCDGSDCNPFEYFNMIAWCLLMYRTGCCPNVDYVYNYRTSPCHKHCCEYLSGLNSKMIRFIPPTTTSLPTTLSTSAALLLLIPRWGSKVLPPNLLYYMEHPELIHWYPPACMKCDEYRNERKLLMTRQELQIKEMKQNSEKDDVVLEESLGELLNMQREERKIFEEKCQAHVKEEHPVLPPPVNIVRRLLGKRSIGNDSPFSHPVLVDPLELIPMPRKKQQPPHHQQQKQQHQQKQNNNNNQQKKRNGRGLGRGRGRRGRGRGGRGRGRGGRGRGRGGRGRAKSGGRARGKSRGKKR